jgi:hypothetical protein
MDTMTLDANRVKEQKVPVLPTEVGLMGGQHRVQVIKQFMQVRPANIFL